MRYIKSLENKDLSLNTHDPARLVHHEAQCGNGTNARELAGVCRHSSICPLRQAEGYHQIFRELESALCQITGLAAASLQPNSGAQGEFTGLLVIRAYHAERGESMQECCTHSFIRARQNPASAVMAGLKVVVVACDNTGNIDVDDLRSKQRDTKRPRRIDGDLPVHSWSV